MHRALALPLALLAAAAAGCSGGSAASGPAPAATVTVTATPTPSAPVGPKTAAVGQRGYTYPDGLAVRVLSVARFTPQPYEVPAPSTVPVRMRLQVANGTGSPVQVDEVEASVTGADGQQAMGVMYEGATNAFSGTVMPGKTQTSVWAFEVPAAGARRVQIEVRPGTLERDSVVMDALVSPAR